MIAKEMALCDLPCGVPATVLTVTADDVSRARLLELGMLPGSLVSVVRRSPFGCPVEVDLSGARYTMRRETTAGVLVRIRA